MAASNHSTPPERTPVPAWFTVKFPAPLLGLSSWSDVLSAVTGADALAVDPDDDEGVVAA
jgi:hypothetical protein